MLTNDQYRKEYIWGFTQGSPMKYSSDNEGFSKLMKLISRTGTISIGASFHPYQLLDGKGNDLWESLLGLVVRNNAEALEKLKEEKAFFHMDPPSAKHFPIVKWEDERLFIERNPEFGKFVPFVIPFITHDDNEDPLWLTKIQNHLKEQYTAEEFIAEVNEASRFIMPKPTFILGFDIFDKENPSALVDHYVNFLENVIKTK